MHLAVDNTRVSIHFIAIAQYAFVLYEENVLPFYNTLTAGKIYLRRDGSVGKSARPKSPNPGKTKK
jgi:hypothetical protein